MRQAANNLLLSYPLQRASYQWSPNWRGLNWSLDELQWQLQAAIWVWSQAHVVFLPGSPRIYQLFHQWSGYTDRNIPFEESAAHSQTATRADSRLAFNPPLWNKVDLYIYLNLFHLGFMPFWFHETGGPGTQMCNPLSINLLFVPDC